MSHLTASPRPQDYQEMNAKRNHYYQQFLDATNRKGAIFRDTIIESDYDPMEANREGIKIKTGESSHATCRRMQIRVREGLVQWLMRVLLRDGGTGKLFDPTSRVIDKEEEEKGLIDPKNRSRQPIGREVLDVRLWETGSRMCRLICDFSS